MKTISTVFVLFLFFILPAQSQEVRILSRQPGSSFEGRHFYVGFMDNATSTVTIESSKSLQLHIATSFKTNVTVTFPEIGSSTYSLKADTVLIVNVPLSFESIASEVVSNRKLVEVRSDVPVSVYSFNSKTNTSDIYNAIPVASWGTEYVAVSLPNDAYTSPPDIQNSEFMILAAENGTEVKILASSNTVKGKIAGVEFTVSLNKGESFLVKSDAPSGSGDLSGSRIRSNKPIGVLSGHVRAAIPRTESSRDHLVEMLPPTSAWGKKFVTVPFFTKYYVGATNTAKYTGDIIHVVNALPDTRITWNPLGAAETLFDFPFAGSFKTHERFERPAVWEWDKPVCVSQFMYSQVFGYESDLFDPSLTIITPTEQYISRSVFLTPSSPLGNLNQFMNHYVNFVCDSMAIDNARLDGKLITEIYPNIKFQYTGFNPRYYWARIPLKEGKHIIQTEKGRFSGVLFGTGLHDSYATTLGFSLLDTAAKNDSVPPMLSFNQNCGTITAEAIDIDVPGKSNLDYISVDESKTTNYAWDITYPTLLKAEITARPIDFFQDGSILIEARDRAGNGVQSPLCTYKAPLHKISAAILFKSVSIDEPKCIMDSIVNPAGDRSLIINGLGISGDPRITFKDFPAVPITIPPNGVYRFTLCYTPGAGGEKLESEVIVDFGCDRFKRIAVSGIVRNIDLSADDHDFKNVRVGDTVYHNITISNGSSGTSAPIRINSLVCLSCTNDFAFDTTGVFPVDLAQGKILSIPVRFIPSARGDMINTLSVDNTPLDPGMQPISALFNVLGKGVAPEINALNVDFKKRRVGTKTDSMIIIRNNGDAVAVVSFKNMSTDFLKAFELDTLGIFPATIQSAPPQIVKLNFIPDAPGDFRDSLSCSVDWRFHAPVNIAYSGTGTLPVIETDSIEFAAIEEGKQRDTTASVIFSKGNEDLTVHEIIPYSGDVSVFEIAPGWFDWRVVPQGSDDILKVNFKPASAGDFSAVYAVVHDAMPDYGRDTSYIEVRGTAFKKLMPDSLRMTVAAGIKLVQPCAENNFDVVLRNTSNVPVLLDSFSLVSDDAVVNYSFSPTVSVIDLNSFTTIPVSLHTGLQDSVTLYFSMQISDTARSGDPAVIRDTLRIGVQPQYVTLQPEPSFEGVPGNIVDVVLKGEFTAATDKDYLFKSSMNVDLTLLQISGNRGTLIITDVFKEQAVPVTISQDGNAVHIAADFPVKIDAVSQWKVTVPFEIMLGMEFETDLTMTVEGNECYIGDTANSKFYVVGVCSPYTRRVHITDELAIMATYPNPASTDASVDIMLPESGAIDITATDILGNVFFIERNLYLTKGAHSRKLDITKLQSGMYKIDVRLKTDTKHSFIIINK